MAILFANNCSSTLSVGITAGSTVIQVADSSTFPQPTGGDFIYITLEDPAGDIEIVRCSANDGAGTFTVDTGGRGIDGTTAQAFNATETRVELRLVKTVLEAFLQTLGGTMSGNLDLNNNNIIDAVLSGTGTKVIAGEIVGVPLRGLTGTSTNEILVPTDGVSRATAGGAEIVVSTDPSVTQATETALGVAEIATQAEMDAGLDDLRFVTPKKFVDTAASETVNGTLQLAAEADVTLDTPTVADKAVTPVTLAARTASETRAGLAEKATQAEVDAGTDTDRYLTPATFAASSQLAGGAIPSFTGTSSITGLTVGKKYLVSVYGITRDAGTGTATLGAVRVGDGASVGQGTQLATTGTQSINWPDGNVPQSATFVITAATANINGAVDWRSTSLYVTPKTMTAIQLD